MTNVRILLGSNNLDFTLHCIKSFIHFCKSDFKLYIHEDGSFNKEQKNRVALELRNPIFVGTEESDAYLLLILKKYPKCEKERKNFILFRKLFDCTLMNRKNEKLLILDSDILFYRPFFLPQFVSSKEVFFFKDVYNSYSLYPSHLAPFGKLKINGQINSGFVFMTDSNLNLDFIESFLTNDTYSKSRQKKRHYVEQTLYALEKSNYSNPLVVDSKQFVLANNKMKVDLEKLVAIHFVGPHRHLFEEFKKIKVNEDVTVNLVAEKAKKLTPLLFLMDIIRFKLIRYREL